MNRSDDTKGPKEDEKKEEEKTSEKETESSDEEFEFIQDEPLPPGMQSLEPPNEEDEGAFDRSRLSGKKRYVGSVVKLTVERERGKIEFFTDDQDSDHDPPKTVPFSFGSLMDPEEDKDLLELDCGISFSLGTDDKGKEIAQELICGLVENSDED